VAPIAPGTEPLTLPARGLEFDALAAGPPGAPLVLFLHGFPEFATSWRGQLAAVAAAGYRAVAVDQRGYSPGARPADPADYAVAELAADVIAFADALGADRFHLVAHDWGGVVAWPVAALHAERVASLVVLSTPHPRALAAATAASEEQRDRLGYIRAFRREGAAEAALLADGGAVLARLYGGRVPDDLVADNVRRLSAPGALTAALNWYRALHGDAADAPAIGVPTRYLWGDGDVAFTAAAAEATGDWVTASYTYTPLAGASHWLPEERPDRVTGPLLEHLAAHA
jgi:pimeloyl-ACP methyl ester carboxylesterase